jgi:hypothetical protein
VSTANGAQYGRGVYTATSSIKACKYSTDSGCLILSRSLQGKSGASHTDNIAQSWPGGDEGCIVFRDSAQLLPVFVIHYAEEREE